MLRHVLIPLDGSPLAEKALDAAKRILSPDGKITLISSADVEFESAHDDLSLDNAGRVKAYLDHVAMNLKLSGFHVDVEVGSGDPGDLILSRAYTLGVETIVMSTHGRSGLSRLLFGSITLKVLGETPCPVYIVPNREQQRVPDEAPAAATNLGLDALTAD